MGAEVGDEMKTQCFDDISLFLWEKRFSEHDFKLLRIQYMVGILSDQSHGKWYIRERTSKEKCLEMFYWTCRKEPVRFRDTCILFPRQKHHSSSGGIVVFIGDYSITGLLSVVTSS